MQQEFQRELLCAALVWLSTSQTELEASGGAKVHLGVAAPTGTIQRIK